MAIPFVVEADAAPRGAGHPRRESDPKGRSPLPVPERKGGRAWEIDRDRRPGRPTRQGEDRNFPPAAESVAELLGCPQQQSADQAGDETTGKLKEKPEGEARLERDVHELDVVAREELRDVLLQHEDDERDSCKAQPCPTTRWGARCRLEHTHEQADDDEGRQRAECVGQPDEI